MATADEGLRRVQLPLIAAGLAGVAVLPFLQHARNRLISGQPVALAAAVGAAGSLPALALGACLIGLLIPVVLPRLLAARWIGLCATGLALAAALWLAGSAALALATEASAPAARTSFGPGFWVLIGALLLLASDALRRLDLTGWTAVAAFLLFFAPTALLIPSGALAQLSLAREYAAQRDAFFAALERHAFLVLGALLPSMLVGIPLGVAAQRLRRLRRIAFPVLNLIQTIPSIALFGLLIGPLSTLGADVPALGRLGIAGVGVTPAILALTLYSLLPIVRNTVEGLDGVPLRVREAARGMGMTRRQAFWRVDAWLALPVLLTGLRVTAVQAVGLAAVSALIGAGGLGSIIFQGLFANALDLVLLGTIPVIVLAVAVDLLFRLLTGLSRAAIGDAA